MVVDRVHKQKTSRPNPVSFEKIVKGLCHDHGYPIKHTLEDYDLIKRYLKGDYKTTSTDKPARPTDDEEKGDVFPNPKGCLMTFDGPAAYESRHRQKLTTREVNAATSLGNRDDHQQDRSSRPHSQPGHFPLVIDPIIGTMRVS